MRHSRSGRNAFFSLAALGLPLVLVLTIASSAAAEPYAAETTRISVAADGTQGNGYSTDAAISPDGRYIAFSSVASNLVVGDTNDVDDIFLTDTTTGITTRVSTATGGIQSNGGSHAPAMSADARYIAYYSNATNLIADDTNSRPDIYLTDTTTGTTTRVSIATDGAQGDESSFLATLSADGRYIAYYSYATNLVAGDTNNNYDVFVRDTTTGTTTRISTATDGTQGDLSSYAPSMSADGRFITYYSFASNLAAGDTNGVPDIFLTDTTTGVTTRISTATDGTQGNGYSNLSDISADGRYVTYYSYANNLVAGDTNADADVFLRDIATGVTTRISTATDGTQGDAGSYFPAISADGRYISYGSAATNLVGGDTNGTLDLFLRDTTTGTTTRISTHTDGTQSNGTVYESAITADGRYVAYPSEGSTLVDGDTNAVFDIFLTRVGDAPTVVTHPVDDSVTAGETASFTAAFTDATTIQWQIATDPAGPWTDITGATTATLDVDATTAGTSYVRAVATNPGGSASTDAATLTVTAAPIAAPSVTADPVDTSVTAGETASFSTAFTGAETVRWQSAADPAGPWIDIPGATLATLDVPTTDPGTSYVRALGTNASGTATTDVATLTVTAAQSPAAMANTGVDATGPLAVGGLLILVGTLMAIARRARVGFVG